MMNETSVNRDRCLQTLREELSHGTFRPEADLFPRLGETIREPALLGYLTERSQAARLAAIAKAQEIWFGALGWWLARIFMWGALAAGALSWLFFGPKAADPLTHGLSGAMGYYVLIQVLTPLRIRQEGDNLRRMDEAQKARLLSSLQQLEESWKSRP